MKIEIYGHDIELTDPEGEIVTDVIVLARSVRNTDDGRIEDSLLASTTWTTTGMIQRGMLGDAKDALEAPDE